MDELRKTRWFSWTRLAGLAVTAGLFYFILQKVDGELLLRTFRQASPGWVLAGFALYGWALLLGGMRWHAALRLTERTVHLGASGRLLFIGHFFFVALFGAAGGDVAKSAVYARWFRYPLPEVLAAAPLDRGLGSIGTAVLIVVTVTMAWLSDGFEDLSGVHWEWSSGLWFFVVVAVIVISVGVFMWRPEKQTPWARAVQTLRAGVKRSIASPHLGAKAVGCALIHQTTTMSVLVCNIIAVTQEPLSWAQVAWTIPTITFMSCFPVSIAGAGVREVATITLLGLYGVPASECAAAAMLTLLVKLTWAAVGGWIFWREQALQAKLRHRPIAKSISVVIPTYNEEKALPATLARLADIPEILEIIVVDGGSTDTTARLAARHGCLVLPSSGSRGGQLRLGAERAAGDVVFMLHADTWLPREAGRAVLNCLRDTTVVGGGFWKIFRDSPLLLHGSRLKCAVRLWMWKRVAGDQVLFVRREALRQVGGVPDMPLMEEFALCQRLHRVGRLALAGANISTSARRFRERGPIRTYLLMGWIHFLYRLGYPSSDLKRIYENGRLRLPSKKPAPS